MRSATLSPEKTSRHSAATGQRTTALGYKPENVRQDYTGYQKDDESGLEFAQARYYNSSHGRFTSADPLTASANVKDPQTFNRYSYALNSPYKFSDPLGLLASESYGACGTWCPGKGDWVDGSAFRGRDASLDWTQQRQTEGAGPAVDSTSPPTTTGGGSPAEGAPVQQAPSAPVPTTNDTCSIRLVWVSGQTLNSVDSNVVPRDLIGPKNLLNQGGEGELGGVFYTFQVEATVSGNPNDWEIGQSVGNTSFREDENGFTQPVSTSQTDDDRPFPIFTWKGFQKDRGLVIWSDSPGMKTTNSSKIKKASFAINGESFVKKDNTVCSARWSIVQTVENSKVTKNIFNNGRFVVPSDYGDFTEP